MKLRLITTLVFVTPLLMSACSKGVSNDTSPAPGSSTDRAAVSPTPASRPGESPAGRPSMGTAIDTSRLEADIATAEAAHKQKPDDEKARLDLAHAYLARAQALTKAQQYGSALGDYRRTLKYDPQNKAALDMSATIISIFKSLGREAPAEGKEPPPKPLAGNSKDAASYSEKSY